MSDNFWLNNPNILLNREHITEVWPTGKLEYPEKLNAFTRLVILLSLTGYFLTKSIKIPITALITIGLIVMLYKSKAGKKKKNTGSVKEQFTNIKDLFDKDEKKFEKPTKNNPMMNIMLGDTNMERKPAAPSYDEKIEKEINQKAANIGSEKNLFRDLGDSIAFDHSMRQFHTMPNTTTPNDQEAFVKFCYGDMPSCKDVKEGGEVYCG